MKPTEKPKVNEAAQAARLLRSYGARAAQRKTGIHPTTLARIARGDSVTPGTLVTLRGAIKEESDFKVGGKSFIVPAPKKPSTAWPLASVRAARDAQLAGDFSKSQPLATAMKCDDAIFVAYYTRISPISSLAINTVPARAGKSVAEAFDAGVKRDQKTMVEIAGVMAMHGVAFGYNDHVASDDGTSVRFEHRIWPIENIKWDDKRRSYVTKVEGGPDELITHGDGRWTIYAKSETLPHQQEACILPSALIFVAHLDAIRSWSASADSHGQAKVIGTLPDGVSMQEGSEDTMSVEADTMLTTLNELVSGGAGAGLIPHGSDAKFISNGSSAWQVFHELAMDRKQAAARVWLGTDGILGAQGGAPGVDISALFGVALTKVQGDVQAIEDAFYTGVCVPWTAINYGDSTKAPRIEFAIPDADAAQRREQDAKNVEAFFAELKSYKENGFEVNQDVVDAMAAKYVIEPPTLAATGESVPSIQLAPTDVAKVVLVREARASQGLPPFADDRDDMTLTELDEKIKADAAARAALPPVGATSAADVTAPTASLTEPPNSSEVPG